MVNLIVINSLNIHYAPPWVGCATMKYFIRKDSDKFRVYKLKRGTRQIVSIADRAYGTDD